MRAGGMIFVFIHTLTINLPIQMYVSTVSTAAIMRDAGRAVAWMA
jgi:hypothetical protein